MEIFLTLEAMLENDAKDLLSDEEELSSLRSAYKDTWDNLFGGLSEDGCGGDHSQSSTVNMGRDHLASAAHPTDGHDRRLADAGQCLIASSVMNEYCKILTHFPWARH